jgi:hypothetical protein
MTSPLIVGSDGMGSYGAFTITIILQIAFPDSQIVWTNQQSPHIVVKSFFTDEERHPGYTCPYITWSGEPYPVKYNVDNPPLLQIRTDQTFGDRDVPVSFYVPFGINHLGDVNVFIADKKENLHHLKPYFCLYVASNCIHERDRMYQTLKTKSSDIDLHSLGRCQNNLQKIRLESISIYNHILSFNLHREKYDQNMIMLRHYRFALVMENTNIPGYVTEKIINAFRAGTIPIYWGSKKYIDQLFNPAAFINVDDFPSYEACVNYVIDLDKDLSRFKEMQNQPLFRDNIPDFFLYKDSVQLDKIGAFIRLKIKVFD